MSTRPLPVADVLAVQLHDDSPPQCVGRVTVRCPFCRTLHCHRVFANDRVEFTRTAPCSTEADVRQYHVNLNARVPKRDVSGPHTVAGEVPHDGAISVPVLNWEE